MKKLYIEIDNHMEIVDVCTLYRDDNMERVNGYSTLEHGRYKGYIIDVEKYISQSEKYDCDILGIPQVVHDRILIHYRMEKIKSFKDRKM